MYDVHVSPTHAPTPTQQRTVRDQAIEIFKYLADNAWRCSTLTYEEVGEYIGIPPPAVGRALTYMRRNALAPMGLPELWCMCVNKRTRRPGSGGDMTATWLD